MHCFLFWGGDIKRAYQSARQGRYDDRHHEHMAKHYKETPWWWYVAVLVISFVLGLVVVLKENITLSAWAYIVSLIVGIIISPFVSTSCTILPLLLTVSAEYHSLLSLRQRNCHQQPLQDVGRTHAPRATRRKHVLCSLVPQCHLQRREPIQRLEDGRIP